MGIAPAESTATTQLNRSHKGRHRSRNRSGADPFLELSDDSLKEAVQALPEQASNTARTSSEDSSNSGHSESFLSELFMTPVYVISFILSLRLVERQHREWRLAQHAPGAEASSLWSRWWSSPEPYQQTPATQWRPQYSWRRRGIAKMQMNDVFAVRSRVVVALAFWTALGLLVTAYAIRHIYFWAMGS
ncbi:unnamed protein product [Zymoseptoria tritici ST99CH_1A5]|uniref:Uncharacterized protein n=2 Tax=Zymoseptoria tritici TaxID=1047171 RepID=A0A2H1GNS1_ZYMTR|nr:unnamed protein product [Zymoseptoria tritici ST99CH_1E4]SMR57556.1 unnamed protein product [Zymoseptoria tritici ST99CH_3D1]SMY25995.1 unnamed protein product [Zymoseptoria tritici ST99CH_1A5]